MRWSICTIGAISVLGGIAVRTCAQDGSLVVLKDMKIEGGFFIGKSKGRDATDISGIACLPGKEPPWMCLLVNDENKNAQFASIEDNRLIVGPPIQLIGDQADWRTLGTEPVIACKNIGQFEDLDGEGVAYAEPYFYVVGSHGCSRRSGEFQLSSFILARVRVDRQGRPIDGSGNPLSPDKFDDAVETTYRVSDLLKRADDLGKFDLSPVQQGEPRKRFFGKDLKSENGLNIEGIAVEGTPCGWACGRRLTTGVLFSCAVA
jgi:hypothetical protein